MTATQVTLLNASYEHHDVVSFKHAVRMLFRGVATVEESVADKMIGPHPWPKVIRLVRYVSQRWLHRPAGWSRRGILIRDGGTCGYCGAPATTIDHLLPASRGGPWSWENCVAACRHCNERKGNRTPEEAGMRLKAPAYHPTKARLITLQAAAAG
ncbi:HNH endonuclease [Nocardioides limicola]|uniref:HNH endonuclease n=1 Tax=Nocardioides limicola TaxID=2803368 RepID=UPI0027DC2F59|nr:HNH endonuclease [Nocardioides sp. DJM-14]